MRVDLCRFRTFAGLLRELGHDLVFLSGGMGANSRAAALAHLQPHPWQAAAPGRGHWPRRLAKASTARRSRLACISAEHPVAPLRGQGMMPSWIS
jgi:hypothetical protein